MSADVEWLDRSAEGPGAPDDGLHRQIARIEERIEALAQSAERCRKLHLFAKALVLAGAVWIIALMVGALGSGPFGLIGSTTAFIGGIVLMGSNSSTARQVAADIQAAEARRAELISGMELREVSEP